VVLEERDYLDNAYTQLNKKHEDLLKEFHKVDDEVRDLFRLIGIPYDLVQLRENFRSKIELVSELTLKLSDEK